MIVETLRETFLPATQRNGSIRNSGYPWTFENPNLDLRDPSSWEALFNQFGGKQAAAGLRVSHQDALTFGPIMRALKILGGDTACSPLHVCWKNVQPGDDTVDENHPADYVVSQEWNPETSAEAGWERFVQEAGLFGNAYAWIERDSRHYSDPRRRNWGNVTGLYHMVPLCTWPKSAPETGWYGDDETGFVFLEQGERFYETKVANKTVILPSNEVLHYTMFRGMKLPMLDVIRDIIGLSLAARGFQSKFFAHGAQAGGFISMPAESTPASAINLQRELQKRQSNDAWFKVHVLRDGATFHKLTVDPKSADMKSIDEQAAQRVADFYNINPQKMGLPGSDSFGAGESARVDHVTSTMNHVFKQIQGECRIKLFSPRTRRQRGSNARCFRHDHSHIIEPDYKTRIETELMLRRDAVINANDVLSRLGRRTRTDEAAFEYFNPSTSSKNLDEDTPDDQDTQDNNNRQQPDEPDEDDDDGQTDTSDQTQILRRRRQAIEGRVRAVARIIRQKCYNKAKNPDRFRQFIQSGFGEHRPVFRDEVEPVAQLWDVPETVIATAECRFFDGMATAISESLSEQETQQNSDSAQTDKTPTQRRRDALAAADDLFYEQREPQVVDLLIGSASDETN